jgi:RsiW-degrading membrane proteinase PrsW (M82 family)
MGLVAAVLISFACALLYAAGVYWLDRYEKEPRRLLGGVFTWGALFAAAAAYVANGWLTRGLYTAGSSAALANLLSTRLLAPVLEESLKGLAVLAIFLLYRHEFDSLVDGMVYAAVTALGFAATENAYYIYTHGYLVDGWPGLLLLSGLRIGLLGWQHPFCTAFIGIGLGIARFAPGRGLRLAAPLAGWLVAVAVHALHNGLAGVLLRLGGLGLSALFDWSGWVLMLVFGLWALSGEAAALHLHLAEEVDLGIISPAQYRTACSAWRQGMARLAARGRGCYAATAAFYQLCGELALKKREAVALGLADGDDSIIASLRARLSKLSPSAGV